MANPAHFRPAQHRQHAAAYARPAPRPIPSPQALPTNADGSLKFHSIIVLDPKSSSHSWSAFCWKTAAIGVWVLYGVAACTGFVFASLYAPAILPYVAIATIFLIIGVQKVDEICTQIVKDKKKLKKEDTFVEGKLEEWKTKSFDQVLQDHEELLNRLRTSPRDVLDDNELSGHDEDLNRLKIPFARFLYQCTQETILRTNYQKEKIAETIETVENRLKNVESRIQEAQEEAKLDFSDLRNEYSQNEKELQELRTLRKDYLGEMAGARATAAQYLYLLHHPLNHIDPKISPLTCEISPHTPGFHIFDDPVTPPHRYTQLPFADRPFKKLPNGREVTITELRETSIGELSRKIEDAVNIHLDKADQRASAAAAHSRL